MQEGQANSLKCCVIIPTYNNQNTLKRVLDGVLKITDKVIIVNDGSTDDTKSILAQYKDVEQIHFKKNIGKGFALRKGFEKALDLDYSHAITIDSDGQHYPEDILLFLEFVKDQPETLVIGSRNMNQEGVPNKSSFGNKFSNFWFWFETGLSLKDTQSGFRLYPIKKMPKSWFTKKFEFEIEVIVRSAWKGINVCNIPIQIKYDPEERVSHFRPFKDFSRISVLNTILVLIAIFYIKPRDFFNRFKKKSLRDFFIEDVVGSNDSPKVKSTSISLGVFIGIIPIWGFQTITVIFLAITFRLNKLLAFAGSNISIPPMIPIIVFASLKIGGLVLNNDVPENEIGNGFNFGNHLLEYIVGSFILATLSAISIWFISYFLLLKIERKSLKKDDE
ncbi:MAG: glycosyltransferase [Fluviicola sp.]|nr:MAG: glycosyltransferase [Fluviicola sp.]